MSKFPYRNNSTVFRTHFFCQHVCCLRVVTWQISLSSITLCYLLGIYEKTWHFWNISKHLKGKEELHISDLPHFQLSPAFVCESSLQLVREKQPNSENWDKFNRSLKKAASVFDLCRQQYKETFTEMCYLQNRVQPHLLHLSDLVIWLSILSESGMMSALIPFHHNKGWNQTLLQPVS